MVTEMLAGDRHARDPSNRLLRVPQELGLEETPECKVVWRSVLLRREAAILSVFTLRAHYTMLVFLKGS